MSGETQKFITAPQAAKRAGVHERTIRRWIERGDLPAKQVASGSKYIIREEDFEKAIEYTPTARKKAGKNRQKEKD